MKNNKIPYSNSPHKFRIPQCYKDNPELLEARAKKEDVKHNKEEAEFFEWYNKQLKVNGYKDGKLATTISLLGKEMKQDIPVTLTNDGSKATILGTFDLDLKSLNIEGLKVNEEKPDATIKSIVSFDLNLVLNKK